MGGGGEETNLPSSEGEALCCAGLWRVYRSRFSASIAFLLPLGSAHESRMSCRIFLLQFS
jgi:hypothetical protein